MLVQLHLQLLCECNCGTGLRHSGVYQLFLTLTCRLQRVDVQYVTFHPHLPVKLLMFKGEEGVLLLLNLLFLGAEGALLLRILFLPFPFSRCQRFLAAFQLRIQVIDLLLQLLFRLRPLFFGFLQCPLRLQCLILKLLRPVFFVRQLPFIFLCFFFTFLCLFSILARNIENPLHRAQCNLLGGWTAHCWLDRPRNSQGKGRQSGVQL
mmetsp:Transcript_30585/g.72381  ORF Transcript_30585/g.72381 Transcript_30585/m.72381 type:complete len:207 (-) Transcript_30585:76-696(-)